MLNSPINPSGPHHRPHTHTHTQSHTGSRMLNISSVPLAPAAGLGVGALEGVSMSSKLKKLLQECHQSPPGATGTGASSSADPPVTSESPVCIPHTTSGSGEGPLKPPWGPLII